MIGHHVRVLSSPNQRWQVWVDAQLLDADFPFPHEAWARGVAESYRRGPLRLKRVPEEPEPEGRGAAARVA